MAEAGRVSLPISVGLIALGVGLSYAVDYAAKVRRKHLATLQQRKSKREKRRRNRNNGRKISNGVKTTNSELKANEKQSGERVEEETVHHEDHQGDSGDSSTDSGDTEQSVFSSSNDSPPVETNGDLIRLQAKSPEPPASESTVAIESKLVPSLTLEEQIADDKEGPWLFPKSPRRKKNRNKNRSGSNGAPQTVSETKQNAARNVSPQRVANGDHGSNGAKLVTHCKVVHETPDVTRLCSLVKSPFAGAVVTFSGTTRNNFKGKAVVRLEYEAYESMAEKVMTEIANEIRGRWPDIIGVAIEHKVGTCPILDTSVVIAVSSGHRVASLQAAHFAIDELKARVPVWKRELYAKSGESPAWKENAEFFARESAIPRK